ncbi:MAG: hypothetical protein EPN91_08245 [Salinibacterium sp.]|nr:MAG: hypothetical protein EPN91_08245 [Salinibacterium sp.]
MTYEQARREVRKLLRSSNGEVKELPVVPSSADFTPYRFLVGTGRGKNFVAITAGMTWADALDDLRKRLGRK